MKTHIYVISAFLLVLLPLTSLRAQEEKKVFYQIVELRASVDAMGNIYMSPAGRKRAATDSLLQEVHDAINLSNEPINVLNSLAKKNWELVTVTQVLSDKSNNPNTPFLLYYIRKLVISP